MLKLKHLGFWHNVASSFTGVLLWKLKYGAFIHLAQRYLCQRLIIVPLSTFYRLADEIGDPHGELTFLFHAPRSGSTLLMQVYFSTTLVTGVFLLRLQTPYCYFG